MGAPTTLTVIGIIFLLFGVFVGWFAFPKMLHKKILESKSLNPRSTMRQMWSHPPISADFKIYLFNVTNPEEAQKGEKIIIKEVGPYVYHEWKEKENLIDDIDEDTVEFSFKNTFVFDEMSTLPLTGDEILVMPHLAMIGMVTMTKMMKPAALGLVNKAIPYLYPDQTSAFMTATANDIMWNGLDINCTSGEFAAVAICSQIRQNSASLHKISKDHFKFSLFGVKNGTIESNRYTVKRGYKMSPLDVGQVVRFNDKHKMEVWPGDECNRIYGTDTTIFQPFITRDTNLASFSGDICRSLAPDFLQETKYNGLNVFEYSAVLVKPEEKCFCLNQKKCLKHGALDLTNCSGAPIIATLPHFYKSEEYLNNIDGLNPEVEKHRIQMYFEPMTGTPLLGYKRLQFNIFLKKESKISVMKTLNEDEKLIPLFWVEEGVALNKTWTNQIKNKLYLPITIMKYVKYIFVVFGVVFIILAVVVNYNSVKTMEVTPKY
ncbi:sensory neuron membrane protein 1-like [Rhopalosiphum maidis]|uniref:sensory neuron membrane protein 1-like n=1 Tax=Rhopalosiphum maidis TaxID=43146 RepID=UPI000EFE1242|nr:sensory neuron membrane protein 1-like [Rhopalosiphum maidis]